MASAYKSVFFEGDVDILAHPFAADGTGNLNVAAVATVNGAVPSTSVSTGAVVVPRGGVGVSGDAFIGSTLNVAGQSNLNSTVVNTTNAPMQITGVGVGSGINANTNGSMSFNTNAGISLSAGATSLFSTSSGNLSILSNLGSVIMNSGAAAASAVQLNASNANGGVNITSGTGGNSLVSTGASTFALNSDANADLLIRRYGSTATANTSGIILSNERGTSTSSINIRSTLGGITESAVTNWSTSVTAGGFSLTGNGATSTLGLTATSDTQNLVVQLSGNTASQLQISSSSTSDSAVNMAASAGGITCTAVTKLRQTVSAGPFALTSTLLPASVGSSIIVNSTAANQDFNIALRNAAANSSRLIMTGQGNTVDALLLSAPAGGITANSASGLYVTSTAGPFSISGTGGASGPNLTYTSLTDGTDFVVQLAGGKQSRLRMLSAGTGSQAVDIEATAGGIYAAASGPVTVQSSDTTTGITIGTTVPNVPVTIGNATASTVTVGRDLVVNGNLLVSGGSSSVQSTILEVKDNVIMVNSGPGGTSDSGIVMRRWQTQTGGDVVQDTPNETGTLASGTTTSVTLGASGSSVANFYQGYWIKVTYASNSTSTLAQIASYNSTTKVATFVSGQTITAPAAGDSYALYGHAYCTAYYNEFTDVYDIAYTNIDPTANSVINVTGRPGVTMGALALDRSLQADTITRNTSTGVAVEGVSFSNGAITNVTSINGNSVDKTVTVSLADAVGTASGVLIAAVATPGPYRITVNDATSGGANAIFYLSKSSAGNAGQVNRVASSSGSLSQRIEMIWNANQAPTLYYSVRPGDSSTRNYLVRISSV